MSIQRIGELVAARRDLRRRLRDAVSAARGTGESWTAVGAALGLEAAATKAGVGLAEAAFEHMTYGIDPGEPIPDAQRFREPTFTWRCGTCRALVIDHGPYNGNPVDDEHGHTGNCPRHTAEVAAWRATADEDW